MTDDLNFILSETRSLWDEFLNKRIFLTGGTGFFGTWLLQTFAWAEDQLALGVRVVVLSRDPDSFKKKNARLGSHPAISFIKGDVLDFPFSPAEFSHVIHAAIPGTPRVLEFARASGAKKFLITSSGAVYGDRPFQLKHVTEEDPGLLKPLNSSSEYGQEKRKAEHLCVQYLQEHGLETKIARCFAFVGPHLPMDGAFAIGNFIRDGFAGQPIQVNGDGTPYRSYLYAAELVVWLLTVLVKGKAGRAYNVGSGSEITIHELADQIARLFHVHVTLSRSPASGDRPEWYVPDVTRIRQELGLVQKISLPEGLERTLRWYREQHGSTLQPSR